MVKFLLPLFALALLVGCSGNPDTTMNDSDTSQATSDDSMMEDKMTDDTPPGFDGQLLSGIHTVTLKTSEGDVTLELNADAAPKAVTNFVVLAQMGFYDGLTFHRIIPGFMIQGGDPNGNGTGGASIFGETFEDEQNNISLERGVIAMANRGPNTNGSQFFIITAEATPWLQGRHTAFGRVVSGMDTVDEISQLPRNESDMPNTPVTFSVEVEE